MKPMRKGIPLAVFLTVMNIWVAQEFSVPIWKAFGNTPMLRLGILLLAGLAFASLSNAWAQILEHPTSPKPRAQPIAIPGALPTENADV